MISFTLLTTTPAILRDRLVSYGWLDAEFTPRDGLEFVEVPNPIVVTPAGPVDPQTGLPTTPAVMDTRRVFMVKIAHKAFTDDTDGEDQLDNEGNLKHILLRTKFGKALMALNPTRDDITVAPQTWTRRWTTQEEQIVDGETVIVIVPHEEEVAYPTSIGALNIADNLWILLDDDPRFPSWQ